MVLAQLPKHRSSAHEKKRHGHHHKTSKHYAKAYWPYLPMLVIVVFGFAIHAMWNSKAGVLSYATNMNATSLLQETNIHRTGNSLGALALNSQLSQAAQEKANDMVARNYWSHTSPEGTQPWQFISAVGYHYTAAGENLAYGFDTSAAAVVGWMNSPGHKANVLGANYKDVGFGIANSADYQGDGEQTIVVAMYAAAQGAAANAGIAQPAASKPKETAPAAAPPVTTPAPSEQLTASPPAAAEQPAPTQPKATAAQNVATATPLTSQKVSRIDVLTAGNAQWAALVTSLLVTVSAVSLVYRHARLWHKYLVRGEYFIIRHPVFDTLIVAVVVVGILLTGTSGFIH